MKTIKIIVLCAAALFATEASAVTDGNKLKEWANIYQSNMTSRNASFAGGLYAGYVEGVVETAFIFKPYCPPKEVINSQFFDVVIKYLNDNPAKLHLSASDLIIQAMIQAFPCAK